MGSPAERELYLISESITTKLSVYSVSLWFILFFRLCLSALALWNPACGGFAKRNSTG